MPRSGALGRTMGVKDGKRYSGPHSHANALQVHCGRGTLRAEGSGTALGGDAGAFDFAWTGAGCGVGRRTSDVPTGLCDVALGVGSVRSTGSRRDVDISRGGRLPQRRPSPSHPRDQNARRGRQEHPTASPRATRERSVAQHRSRRALRENIRRHLRLPHLKRSARHGSPCPSHSPRRSTRSCPRARKSRVFAVFSRMPSTFAISFMSSP